MPLYRPRAVARLTLPVLAASREIAEKAAGSDTVSINIVPRRVSFERNDHMTADECEVEIPFDVFGIDPRLITSGTIDLWMGNADESGQLQLSDENHRFVGPFVGAGRKGSETGNSVTLRAHDNTRFFLDRKPYPTDGYPELSSTLDEAWRVICEHTAYASVSTGALVSLVTALQDRIFFSDDLPEEIHIGAALPKRMAALGRVQPINGEDAWSLWQRICLSVGLVTFIDRNDLIVSSAIDYWSRAKPAFLVWGSNVKEFDQDRRIAHASETGIRAVSYNPITGTTLEALWPPLGDAFFQKKRAGKVSASTHKKPAKRTHVDKYRTKLVPWIVDESALLATARTYWLEECRQDFEMRFSTSEMSVAPNDSRENASVDLLDLRSGDAIALQIEDFDLSALPRTPTKIAAYLVDRGYDRGVAELMAKSADALGRISSPKLHVKTMRVELEATPEGGKFDVAFIAHNLIDTTGQPAAGV